MGLVSGTLENYSQYTVARRVLDWQSGGLNSTPTLLPPTYVTLGQPLPPFWTSMMSPPIKEMGEVRRWTRSRECRFLSAWTSEEPQN